MTDRRMGGSAVVWRALLVSCVLFLVAAVLFVYWAVIVVFQAVFGA